MTRWAFLAAVVVAASAAAQVPAGEPVLTEFRAFNGTDEVTASTRFRLTPVGGGEVIEAKRPYTAIPAGLYDLQALRADRGVIATRRIDALAVMHYPDQGPRHLEVVNFRPGYGALQLRATEGRLEPRQVSLFAAGSRSNPVARAVSGSDYVLFVVPAGQYDVRLDHDDHGGADDSHWVLNVTVAADRTRFRLIDVSVGP